MGIIIRQYGLDILTSMVGSDPNKFTFKDEQEAIWAAHMATELLNLHGHVVLNPMLANSGYYISVGAHMHDPQHTKHGWPTYEFRGYMLRLEYQTNIKHLFDAE